MQPLSGSMHNMQQPPQANHSLGYYDSLQQQQAGAGGGGYPQDGYSNRQDSYRPDGSHRQDSYRPDGSQPRLYVDQNRQNSYMQHGSERGGYGGGGLDDRQDSYRPSQGPPSEQGGGGYRQESYRAPVSEHDYRQDSYRAPPSEQYGQDSYRAAGPGGGGGSEHGAPYREDSYRRAPSEQDSYRATNQTELYGQHPGPPSEHDSYRPNHVGDPYSLQGGGAPASEQGSYRADPYAQAGQFDRYDDYGRGPPDGIEPSAQEYIPPGAVPLFPNHHAVGITSVCIAQLLQVRNMAERGNVKQLCCMPVSHIYLFSCQVCFVDNLL